MCDGRGRCVCQGELERPDDLFQVEDSQEYDAGVGRKYSSSCHHVYNHKVLPNFLKKVIFLPLSRSYIFRSRSNLMTPSYFGLQNAVNFYIPVNDEDAVGKVKSKKTRPDLILLLSQGLGTYGPQMVLLLWKV